MNFKKNFGPPLMEPLSYPLLSINFRRYFGFSNPSRKKIKCELFSTNLSKTVTKNVTHITTFSTITKLLLHVIFIRKIAFYCVINRLVNGL